MKQFVLALEDGTNSAKSIAFDLETANKFGVGTYIKFCKCFKNMELFAIFQIYN